MQKVINFSKARLQQDCNNVGKMQLSISQREHHVESTWIRRGYHVVRRRSNFDEFPRPSTYFFRRNFAGRKIHVVSTYFFGCNLAGGKIHVISTYFFRCNFNRRKIYVVSTVFFRCNFDVISLDLGLLQHLRWSAL